MSKVCSSGSFYPSLWKAGGIVVTPVGGLGSWTQLCEHDNSKTRSNRILKFSRRLMGSTASHQYFYSLHGFIRYAKVTRSYYIKNQVILRGAGGSHSLIFHGMSQVLHISTFISHHERVCTLVGRTEVMLGSKHSLVRVYKCFSNVLNIDQSIFYFRVYFRASLGSLLFKDHICS